MRRTTQLFGVLGLVLLLAACSEPHFMTDTSYRRRVEQDFLQKQALMKNTVQDRCAVPSRAC